MHWGCWWKGLKLNNKFSLEQTCWNSAQLDKIYRDLKKWKFRVFSHENGMPTSFVKKVATLWVTTNSQNSLPNVRLGRNQVTFHNKLLFPNFLNSVTNFWKQKSHSSARKVRFCLFLHICRVLERAGFVFIERTKHAVQLWFLFKLCGYGHNATWHGKDDCSQKKRPHSSLWSLWCQTDSSFLQMVCWNKHLVSRLAATLRVEIFAVLL